MSDSAPAPVQAPVAAPYMPWTQRTFVHCMGCSKEAPAPGYYRPPEGWKQSRYSRGIACPDCAPTLIETESKTDKVNHEASAVTQAAYAPAYAKQTAWDKANPRPSLPSPFLKSSTRHETYIRRITCPGCGRVEVRETPMGTMPSRPSDWRYAGRRRGAGPIVCPTCYESLATFHAEQDAHAARRGAEVGDVFREARAKTVKGQYPTYPDGWRKA